MTRSSDTELRAFSRFDYPLNTQPCGLPSGEISPACVVKRRFTCQDGREIPANATPDRLYRQPCRPCRGWPCRPPHREGAVTAQPLAPVIPSSAVPAARRRARHAAGRPLPLARPVRSVPHDVIYGLARIDSSGRICERAVTTALGWA